MIHLICLITTLLCSLEASWPFKQQGKCGLDTRIKDALHSPGELEKLYEDYKVEHGVDHNTRETPERLKIFKQFLVKVRELKADENVSWNVGITFMAHMTECEKSLYHGSNETANEEWESNGSLQSELKGLRSQQGGYFGYLPFTWDWRKQNAVTPIKDQIGGTCWAHSAVVPLEAQLRVLKGKLKELSTQELIDCVYYGTSIYNDGLGGSKEMAWHWIKDHGRLASRSDIPDREKVMNCKWLTQARHSNALSGYVIQEVRQIATVGDNELPILETLSSISPVAISMQTKDAELDSYMGGPYDWKNTQCKSGDSHAMVIVGYTIRYYIIKNSWGTKWGDSGYLMWVRSKLSGYNCNIFNVLTYPLLVKKRDYFARSEIQ